MEKIFYLLFTIILAAGSCKVYSLELFFSEDFDEHSKSLIYETFNLKKISLLSKRFTGAIEFRTAEIGSLESDKEKIDCLELDDDFKIARVFYNKKIILINSSLINLVSRQAKIEVSNCQYESVEEILKGAVVHEFGHLVDRSVSSLNLRSSEYCKRHKRNRHLFNGKKISKPTFPIECQNIGYQSTSYNYKRLVGWSSGWRNKNISDKSYEYTSLQEHFAENFEAWVMDENYACRRPAYANYFYSLADLEIKSQCLNVLSFYFPRKNELKNFKFENIKEVHYLHAGVGEGLISSQGHSMIRIVVCESYYDENSQCENELYNDFVLSFRAGVDDIILDKFKGFFGGYTTRLYAFTMQEIMREYNNAQLRDLFSYKLELDRSSIKKLLLYLYQTHWTYESEYQLLSNNCAHETQNALREGYTISELDRRESMFPWRLRNYVQLTSNAVNEPKHFKSYAEALSMSLLNLGLTEKKLSRVELMTYFSDNLYHTALIDITELTDDIKKASARTISRFMMTVIENEVSKIAYFLIDKEMSDSETEFVVNAIQDFNTWTTSGKFGIPLANEIASMREEKTSKFNSIQEKYDYYFQDLAIIFEHWLTISRVK